MDNNINQKDKNLSESQIKTIGQKPSHEAVFMTMSKKAEKISTALYMVTDLINANDPIRQRIRECSIELIAESRSMTHAFSGDIYFSIARAINKSWEIISLVEVASSVGFVSDMNARILKSVIIELISSLRDKQKRESFSQIEDMKIGESLSDQISLSKSLFEVKEEVISKRQNLPENKLAIKDKIMSFKTPSPKTNTPNVPSEEVALDNPSYSHKKFTEYVSKPKPSERRSKIIDIIKEKVEVGVNDIMTSFPDVSSKTIQRELTSLVEENVLKREGEKRWSKYSLI